MQHGAIHISVAGGQSLRAGSAPVAAISLSNNGIDLVGRVVVGILLPVVLLVLVGLVITG